MSDDARPSASTLKGRLADVYVPALVSGSLDALSKRLGNRATVDDPLYGRASSLASLEPLIGKVSAWFAKERTTYRHVASTTGVDRDISEGLLTMASGREVPIAVVAERRRLREIELRIYYTPPDAPGRSARHSLLGFGAYPSQTPLAPMMTDLVEALRVAAIQDAASAFEETGCLVDARGGRFDKESGLLTTPLERIGALELGIVGSADDGRTCCIEGAMKKVGGIREPSTAMLAIERGDSGKVSELRLYWE